MRPEVYTQDILNQLCLGNTEASSFLKLWSQYVHDIDDLVDGDVTTKESQIRSYALACVVLTHPFFIKHVDRLRDVVLLITNDYADSVAWEGSKEEWQRRFSDVLRHSGATMVREVMLLVGGYDHLRLNSALFHAICHLEQQPPCAPQAQTES